MSRALTDDARRIVRDFVKVQPGETVSVLSDDSRRAEGEALACAAMECGASVIHIDVSQVVSRLMAASTFWLDPPANVVAAVQSSNVNLFAVDETYAFRLDHRVSSLFDTGPECSIFKVDLGMGTWRISPSDLANVEEIGVELVRAIEGHEEVRVSSELGTDVRLSIRGRSCLVVPQVPARGLPYGISVPLWGEYNWAPVEGSPTGVLVIDGLSEAGKVMGVVAEPVVMTVVDGRVCEVHGDGPDAEAFRAVFATDEGAAVVGELGIGGNPNALVGTETEKALLGTVHFGFGSNASYPGGANRSAIHVDGVVRHATVEVDGRVLLEGGHLVREAP